MGIKGKLAKMAMGKNAQQPAAAPVPVAPVVPVAIPWDATRFRIQLKMAKERIAIQHGKKENEADASKRVIADHLGANKETLARIHGERILRERTQLEAFDVTQTFIELLANSNTVFSVQRDFDSASTDIKESVASVVFASARLNIPELQTVTEMFRTHFGPAIVDPLTRVEGPHVPHINKVLARSLEGGAPDGYLVLQELGKIAKEYNINWIPPPEYGDLDPADTSYYRPVPMQHVPHSVPGMGSFPSAPPPDDYGGAGGGYGGGGYGGGGGGMMQPMNIPGHNPFPGSSPYGDIPGLAPTGLPSAPPSAPPPPFDPSSNAPGTLYPPSAPPSEPYHGQRSAPPPPPGPTFSSDDALEARFRNMKDSRK